jgi:hypothetical protein
LWLLLEKKILTSKNLSKRGFEGLSRCVLCGISEENSNHIFVECRFTKDIWIIVLKELRLESIWEGEKIGDSFENWLKKNENWKELPGYLCWEVWKQRNMVIFEGRPINREEICNSIIQDLGETKFLCALRLIG